MVMVVGVNSHIHHNLVTTFTSARVKTQDIRTEELWHNCSEVDIVYCLPLALSSNKGKKVQSPSQPYLKDWRCGGSTLKVEWVEGSPWVAGRDWAPESSVSGVRSRSSLSLSASLLLARSARSLWMPVHHTCHQARPQGW